MDLPGTDASLGAFLAGQILAATFKNQKKE